MQSLRDFHFEQILDSFLQLGVLLEMLYMIMGIFWESLIPRELETTSTLAKNPLKCMTLPYRNTAKIFLFASL